MKIQCDEVKIEPYNGHSFVVDINEVQGIEFYKPARESEVEALVSFIGADIVLEVIGRDKAKEYFDLVEIE